jgi:hypothetical protein
MTIQKITVAALLLTLSACDCGTQTTRRFPKAEVLDDMGNARSSVEFGQVQLNFTATKKVRIRNGGSATLTLEKPVFTKALFALSEALPVTIAVNGEYELPITFTPTVADQRETGTLTISTDDPNKPTFELSLAGTGVTATAVVQPTMIDFGEVYVGEKKEITLTLTNSGSNELPVTSAMFTSTLDPSVTSTLTPLVKTLAGGESVMVVVKFEPTAQVALMGNLELVFPAGVGNKTIPIRGSAIQALPKLCFKFDDSTTESCTDGTTGMSLDVRFGSLCDERVYPVDGGLPCELDGGAVAYERSGTMFIRNDGNTPVSYSMSITAGQPSRCDGGASIDFRYANAPLTADGGSQATWMVPTFRLPNSVNDPRDWKTAPVAVTYRARSACKGGDATDLSTIVWTRQGEPANSMRRPNSMLATLTGNSILADPVPFPVTFTGNAPMPQDVSLVTNTGNGPVRLLNAALWQSADGGNTPGVRCSDVDAGPCTHFAWTEGPTLPVLLEGTNVPGGRISKKVGQISYGTLDGGVYYPPSQEQKVFAIVETTDPYTPTVTVPITGRLQ